MQAISTSHKVYKLEHTFDRFYDGYEYDVSLLDKFPNYKEIEFFDPIPITIGGNEGLCKREKQPNGKWMVTKIHIPESAKYWWGVEEIIKEVDYPYCNQRWPIMSKRMLDVLLSVKKFPHQAIAIDIEDHGLISGATGWERSGIHNHDFVIVQLLEQLDIFDKENSVCDPDSYYVKKMVLKEPETGFPPLFRVSGRETRLYVSAEARTALEEAGIKEVRFQALEGA
jgi:hypothetical protein